MLTTSSSGRPNRSGRSSTITFKTPATMPVTPLQRYKFEASMVLAFLLHQCFGMLLLNTKGFPRRFYDPALNFHLSLRAAAFVLWRRSNLLLQREIATSRRTLLAMT